ncbi:(-)-drimenol synthase-like protein, partial [Drosera capensis]
SWYYIDFYESDPLHNQTLLKFAKSDFNFLQAFHKDQLRDLIRWWKDLKTASELPIRDRVAEGYFWGLAFLYEPQYAFGRIIFTKLLKIVSTIDDLYDAYGTSEELELLTRAIQRWDRSCTNEIPKYMNLGFEPLLDIFEELEKELAKEGRSYCVDYLKEELKAMSSAYMVEARWRHEKVFPTLEEYLDQAAIVSLGQAGMIVTSFLGMGEIATKDAFEWVRGFPDAIRTAGIIGRLLDDLTGHDFEQSRDHVPSAVECYMRQHGVAMEEVHKEFNEQVEKSWKDICYRSPSVDAGSELMPYCECHIQRRRWLHFRQSEDEG